MGCDLFFTKTEPQFAQKTILKIEKAQKPNFVLEQI